MGNGTMVVLNAIASVIIGLIFIYCSYWVLKHGSYFFFYEGMVQDTIREMVKPENLIVK